jgi:hypothetical protein
MRMKKSTAELFLMVFILIAVLIDVALHII